MKITKTLAKKVLKVVDAGLCSGVGTATPGQMCVEAAVCYAMGEPHSDNPTCVSPVLRRFKINLNDKNWSSNQARAKGLRRIAIAQLGTRDTLDEVEFMKRVSKMTIQKTVPSAIRLVAANAPESHKTDMLAAALKCEVEGTREAASEANKVTRKYAAAYAAAAAADAAYAAAAAAYAAAAAAAAYAAAAADAADAAYAAYAAAAADAAADAAYAAAAADAADARDAVLSQYAEDVVQILINMKTPGSLFLNITEV